MKIRKLTKKDFKEVYSIMKKEYIKKPYKEKWNWNSTLKLLNYYLKLGWGYVAIINNKIVGFTIIRKEPSHKGIWLLVEEIAVDSKCHGQGIGRKLMEKNEAYCKKNKIRFIFLMTNKKAPAFKFYEKLGYKHSKNTVYFEKRLR